MVSRGAMLIVVVCLMACMGVNGVDIRHLQRTAPPAQFKQEAKAQAANEAMMKSSLARTQAHLEHETRMLSMQQEESALLLKLKAKVQEREHAERTLARNHLLIAQREAARLVDDLARMSEKRLLINLKKLNEVISQSLLPRKQTTAKPASIAINSKFKQEPAAAAEKEAEAEAAKEGDAATPSNGLESEAKKALHKQLLSKAAEVVSAQLDGILNSEELAYMKAHNELGDTDSEESMDGEIVEEDRDARPGETPDEHYKRLSKEADALMAKAYPFIRCEGGAAGHSSGAHHSSTGEASSTAEHSSTAEESSTAEASSTAEEASSTAESTAAPPTEGLLEATGAAGAATGAAETAAPPAAAGAETTAPPAAETSTAEAAATPPTEAAPAPAAL